jgi:hypothetical protein
MNKWWWKADFNESCNCDHGCPCNWSAIPTHATCDGVGSWFIREGVYGETRLDGLALSILVRFPGPIHRGNGRCIVYIDERADEKQREALTLIGTGQAGPGGPFELFSTLYREPPSVLFGPYVFEREGKSGRVQLGSLVEVSFGPILSDFDQSEANCKLALPNGFIFKEAWIISTKKCEVKVPGYEYGYENSSAFFAEVEYNL